MLSEEMQIGMRVRVRENHRTTTWRGQEGTIVKSRGDPAYRALDVGAARVTSSRRDHNLCTGCGLPL
jgi:hypothetical protein